MCLAVPVKLESVDGSEGTVSLSGVSRKVDLSLVDGAEPGDYLLLHAGFAIEKLNAEEAQRNLDMLREIMEQEQ